MESRTVFVSSENRDQTIFPNGNSYTLYLKEPIKEIRQVELLHASVPNSIYNVTDGSDVLSLSNVVATGLSQTLGDLTTFSIPEGFYGATGLASSITNASSNVSGVTVTYLVNEGKMLFARDTTTTGPFGLYIRTNEMAGLLGFDTSRVGNVIMSSNVVVEVDQNLPLYSDNTIYRGKEFIKSDSVVNMAVHESIFLDIEELKSQFNQDATALNQSGTMTRSFGMIPLDVSSGEIKRFKESTDYKMVVDYAHPIERLDRLTVKWVDRLGQLVTFNGLEDNSFVLKVNTNRKNMCI